ncbi:hypothetical protein [Actinocrispum sp. NPDC049592]|uniref:hypothetical protein n=1 Tax=Actinocrispum sp. NPDC049592 TaxID=3154835 RepID=UPI003438A184
MTTATIRRAIIGLTAVPTLLLGGAVTAAARTAVDYIGNGASPNFDQALSKAEDDAWFKASLGNGVGCFEPDDSPVIRGHYAVTVTVRCFV